VLASSPDFEAAKATARAEQLEMRAETAVISPWIEWQSEGIEGSFQRALNAADYLRLGTAFPLPWQVGVGRDLRRAAEAQVLLAERAARLSIMARAVNQWLDLAVASEEQQVVRERLRRLDQALTLQEARYQLGEVAGTEVRQLDLEHVKESSLLATLEASVVRRAEELRELGGAVTSEPQIGDLAALVASTLTPEDGRVREETILGGSLGRQARVRNDAAAALRGLRARTAWGAPEVDLEWERIPTVQELEGFHAWGFRVSWPLPLGRSGHERKAAAEALSSAEEARSEAMARKLLQQARSALAAARGAEERLSYLVPVLQERNLQEHSLDQQFKLGSISYLVYIDGLSRLDDIRLEAIDARATLLKARLQLAVVLEDGDLFPLVGVPEQEEEP
jgi:outer membrane protein TolC